MAEKQHDVSFWIGVFLGGLMGATVIALLGTAKGKKLLEKLQTGAFDFLDETKDVATEKVIQLKEIQSELVQKGTELIEQGRALQEQVVDTVSDVKADTSEQVAEKVDETLAHIEALQERGRKSTSELRRKLFKNIPRRTVI